MAKPILAQEIKELNCKIATLNSNYNYIRSFWRGVVSGLGSVIGATIVVAILAFMLSGIQLIPVIGEWVSQIIGYVGSTSK